MKTSFILTHRGLASLFALTAFCLISISAWPAETIKTDQGDLVIHPIQHASFVMTWDGKTIYNDPVGGEEAYASFAKPDLILLSDIHGDHLNPDTLNALVSDNTVIVAPQAVYDKLDSNLQAKTTIVANGATTEWNGVKIEALPMYNLTPDRLKYHTKGRGNGYVLNIGGKRIYISGDTEDIPEMRSLKNIDVAFLCMNLPYTMTIDQAEDAVLAFKPAICIPYHYRGSDVEAFKKSVESKSDVHVILLKWYP
ncbi:MAG: MBL fold metallo-hydrolase [bacterium]|nr:MBL fold metallo-hydrolase [bacterium]